jgi:hypothetical protein
MQDLGSANLQDSEAMAGVVLNPETGCTDMFRYVTCRSHAEEIESREIPNFVQEAMFL